VFFFFFYHKKRSLLSLIIDPYDPNVMNASKE